MLLNDPSASQTAARQPLLRVLDGGNLLAGVLSASITQNSYYHASRFNLTFAANAGQFGWWDVNPPLMLDVQIATESGWVSMIVGEVDHMHLVMETGLLTMEGRDLTARLIETKTQATYQNQTSSQVATAIAQEHNLTPVVTATTTLIGRYYQADHVRSHLDQFSRVTNEWDLLVYLAQREGFDVFVQGTSLYFQPATSPNADPFVIRWQAANPVPRLNVTGLEMSRSLTLAKDIEVWVRSWNSRSKTGFTKIVRASGARAASASGTTGKVAGVTNTQRYVFVRPNLTQQQALQLAQTMLKNLTQHERVIGVTMPGETSLTPRNMVAIEGTGTSFDQAYFVDSIERDISFDQGFHQTIRLKNSSPLSQVQVQ